MARWLRGMLLFFDFVRVWSFFWHGNAAEPQMRCSVAYWLCTALALAHFAQDALAGPFTRRQEAEGSGSLTAAQAGETTASAPAAGEQSGSPNTVTTVDSGSTSRGSDGSATATGTASGSTSTSGSITDNGEGTGDCPVCKGASGGWNFQPVTSPSGRECWCTPGDGDTSAKWWNTVSDCRQGSVPSNSDGKPALCIGTGDVPQTKACLSQCNFMLTTINSGSPCNPNLYNAAKSCAGCVNGGALRTDGGGYLINGGDFTNYLSSMASWCAKPNRCIELTTGGPSKDPQCPAPAAGGSQGSGGNNPGGSSQSQGSQSTAGAGSVVGNPSGGSANSIIVSTNTVSTTDSLGHPSISLQVLTMPNPSFTPNTVFGSGSTTGTAPTRSSTGGAPRHVMQSKALQTLTVLLSTVGGVVVWLL